MKKQFLKTAVIVLCLFIVTTAGYMFYSEKNKMEKSTGTGNWLVLLNEIEQLTMDENGDNPAHEHVERLRELLRQETVETHTGSLRQSVMMSICAGAVCLMFMLFYLYRQCLCG